MSETPTTPAQADIFANVSPDEIVFLAGIIAVAITADLSDDNASSLAFLLSTVSSNIGLIVDRRSRGDAFGIPGLG